MWYVKDEYSSKIYFKHKDVNVTQSFVSRYNKTFKFCGQRSFKFVISDFSGIIIFWESKIDVNHFTHRYSFFESSKYSHCLAVRGFHRKHLKYLNDKYKLICKLCKKYHLWSYNDRGRKCDGFDF